MNSFFRELKQRRVYRVAIGYAIAAWLAIQIAATILPAFHAPDVVLPILIVLLGIGFPIALVLAWAFDVTPSGIEKTPETGGMVGAKNRRNGWLLAAAGVVIAALAVGSYWRWRPWKTLPQTTLASQTTESNAATKTTVAEKSIAVLPFESLSEDKSNAYFADGIQDEILARLSKIADLKVISRTSTQKYKSAPDDLRAIAQKLGVANILEGSVQKSNDQVRVTVQHQRAQ